MFWRSSLGFSIHFFFSWSFTLHIHQYQIWESASHRARTTGSARVPSSQFSRPYASKVCTLSCGDLKNGESLDARSNVTRQFHVAKCYKRFSIFDTMFRLPAVNSAKRQLFVDFVFFEIIKIEHRRQSQQQLMRRRASGLKIESRLQHSFFWWSFTFHIHQYQIWESASHRVRTTGFARVPSSFFLESTSKSVLCRPVI